MVFNSNDRSIKTVHKEIKLVNKRIRSKKILLKDFPDDVGLKLSLKQFECRKNDLLRELAYAKNKYKIVSFDISIYDLNKGPITLNVFTDVSTKVNDLIRSCLMSIDGPINKRSRHISKIIENFGLQVDFVDTGSLKITLSEAGNIQHFKDSPLIDALLKLNELIECGEDRDKIIEKMNNYGNKPIYDYKQLLSSVKENNINLKFYENTKPPNFETKEITNKFAKSVYAVIDKAQKPDTNKFPFTGVLYLANSESCRFGIKKGKEKFTGSFAKKLKNQVKLNFDERVTVLLEKTVEVHDVEGEELITYELLDFIDE